MNLGRVAVRPHTTPGRPSATVERPSLMSSLQSWEPWESTLPAGVNREAVETALQAARARLSPCDPKTFAVLMDGLLKFAETFSIRVPDVASLIEIYRGKVGLPADLMNLAVERTKADWKWGNRLPLPGELTGMVVEEWGERERDLRKLQGALRKVGPVIRGTYQGAKKSPTTGMSEAEAAAYWARWLAVAEQGVK